MILYLVSCEVSNNPYSQEDSDLKIYYSSYAGSPKTLDPVKSYSSNEYIFISQIYEPLLQYHYLKRPYTLTSLTAESMPIAKYFNDLGNEVEVGSEDVKYTEYEIKIQPNIFYQPHPAFAKNKNNDYLYHNISPEQKFNNIYDFDKHDTRELVVDDYIYQIKRIALPSNNSPIYSFLSKYIVGLKEYSSKFDLKNEYNDSRSIPLEGINKLDKYTFTIKIYGKYPQFLYWLAMPFFSPIPWEADYFYSQKVLKEQNIDFDWCPIGTGAFMMTKNNPNGEIVLDKNPNYHTEYFPNPSSTDDVIKGYTNQSRDKLPLIDRAIYVLEKENIPRWNKFTQGYFDLSGISGDSFDEAVRINKYGDIELTNDLKEKGLSLDISIAPTIIYLGFNMLDPVVGGYSKSSKLLRQAISIAIDYNEYISIFMNGRGTVANGPIPPNIYKEYSNPFIFNNINNKIQRKSTLEAKDLLAKAGYKNGIDPKTGHTLVLNYDVAAASNNPDDKSRLNWLRKQFKKIGIDLNIRATQYNRFQDKIRQGNAQIFSWGWNADYPDVENFLFLLFGPNSKVKHGGENASNYNNDKFNQLFKKLPDIYDADEKSNIINEMLLILQEDAPWVWGFHPKNFKLSHRWVNSQKSSEIINNTLKYLNIDSESRTIFRDKWNIPILWPLIIIIVFFIILIGFVVNVFNKIQYKKRYK